MSETPEHYKRRIRLERQRSQRLEQLRVKGFHRKSHSYSALSLGIDIFTVAALVGIVILLAML